MVFDDAYLGFTEVDLTKHKCFICDIDGTIADLSHRRKWIEDKPKNWAAFEANMHLDKPIEHTIALVKMLKEQGLTLIMCSGRGEQNRQVTEDWLKDNGIDYEKLYMRKKKDYRADDIIKEELLDKIIGDGYNPTLVFDDRNRVVEMWRRRGLTCIQVAEGDF